MHAHAEPSLLDFLRTIAVARLIFGGEMNLQAPPNLTPEQYQLLLTAGINDWGGVSPLTIDFINPEAPWPQLRTLERVSAELGLQLRQRLPLYPEYITQKPGFIAPELEPRLKAMVDEDGYPLGQEGDILP
jgi:FO synthase